MTASVKCPSCGERNDLRVNRLFCNRCGAKLDLSRLRVQPAGALTVGLFFKRLLRVVVLVTLLGVLVLLLWPAAPEGMPGTEEDGRVCFEKLAELYEAIDNDAALERVFREQEVNGYFDVLLAETEAARPETTRGLNMRAINLSFTDRSFVVHIRAEWKVLQLSYEVEGRPRLRDGRFDMEVLRVSIGHLPLPGPLRQRFAARFLPLFEQMERERYVLDHLSHIDLAPRRVRLSTGR